ncbi:MAG: T9SS type A sorting domain-containing protein [Bacteroidia bacterium]|nr:T9SS type A sorting domain-containing protein [Bacteroidia bacterium]
MKASVYARKKRQLKGLVKKLNREIKISRRQTKTVEQLFWKIRRIISELRHALNGLEIKRLLGKVALVGFPLLFFSQISAQQFAPVVQNPFGVGNNQFRYDPELADLDNDGDLDLLVGGYNGQFYYYQNTGSATNPQFGLPMTNPFGLTSANNLAAPALADLDGDGDLDLLCGDYYGDWEFFENIGTASIPQFSTKQIDPFNLGGWSNTNPAITDIDGDGDFDILTSFDYYGPATFYENIGNTTNPQFDTAQWYPFGIDSIWEYFSPTLGDMDNDGDFDLFVGEGYGNLVYFENTGSPTSPQFGLPLANPFNLTSLTNIYANPVLADLDGDGDLDLLVGQLYGDLSYFENTTISSGITGPPVLEDAFISPNPVSDQFTLTSEKSIDEIEIVDVSGKTVTIIPNEGDNYKIGHLDSGIYFIKARTELGTYSAGKIFKK